MTLSENEKLAYKWQRLREVLYIYFSKKHGKPIEMLKDDELLKLISQYDEQLLVILEKSDMNKYVDVEIPSEKEWCTLKKRVFLRNKQHAYHYDEYSMSFEFMHIVMVKLDGVFFYKSAFDLLSNVS